MLYRKACQGRGLADTVFLTRGPDPVFCQFQTDLEMPDSNDAAPLVHAIYSFEKVKQVLHR